MDNYDNLGGISEPVIGQNKATADVTLKNGEVSLIGGIIQDTNSKTCLLYTSAEKLQKEGAAA